MSGQIVRVRTTPDETRDPVRSRIDDVMDVARVVALEDSHGDALVGIEPRDPLAGHRRRQTQRHREG
jgi:hypothetical protein